MALPGDGFALLERFLQVLESVPDAEPLVAPNKEEFAYMVTALLGAEPELEPRPPRSGRHQRSFEGAAARV